MDGGTRPRHCAGASVGRAWRSSFRCPAGRLWTGNTLAAVSAAPETPLFTGTDEYIADDALLVAVNAFLVLVALSALISIWFGRTGGD